MLELIIEFKGCMVPECRLRHGHRQKAHNGGRVLKRKVTNRQRKHLLTMGPVHPDAQDALQILLGVQPPDQLAPGESEEALEIEHQHLNDIPEAEDENDDVVTEAMN